MLHPHLLGADGLFNQRSQLHPGASVFHADLVRWILHILSRCACRILSDTRRMVVVHVRPSCAVSHAAALVEPI